MISKIPQVTLVFDRYGKASQTKKATVEVRITYNKRQKYLSTGVHLYKNQWKNNTVVNTNVDNQLNIVLDNVLSNIKNVIYDMVRDNHVDIYAVPQKLREQENKDITFLEFCSRRASIRKYGRRKDSQKRYDRFIKYFTAWGKIKKFEDITENNIISYDKYLKSTGMQTYSRWNNYHRFLNSFIIDAINEGYIQKNPYKWVSIDKGKANASLSKHLTIEEFNTIKSKTMPTASLEKVKDLFIFQTYTCLAYSDLRNFDVSNIKEIQGTKVYVSCRKKTGKSFTVPLLAGALEVLNKYNGKLPVISNVKYNEYLKVVAQAAGIDKPLSTHWARHTGATLLLNEGIDMSIVSKICGHSSIKITEKVYANLLDETVVKAIKEKNPLSSQTEDAQNIRYKESL